MTLNLMEQAYSLLKEYDQDPATGNWGRNSIGNNAARVIEESIESGQNVLEAGEFIRKGIERLVQAFPDDIVINEMKIKVGNPRS